MDRPENLTLKPNNHRPNSPIVFILFPLYTAWYWQLVHLWAHWLFFVFHVVLIYTSNKYIIRVEPSPAQQHILKKAWLPLNMNFKLSIHRYNKRWMSYKKKSKDNWNRKLTPTCPNRHSDQMMIKKLIWASNRTTARHSFRVHTDNHPDWNPSPTVWTIHLTLCWVYLYVGGWGKC